MKPVESKKEARSEKESEMEEDEVKQIVESKTDSITCGEKKEVKIALNRFSRKLSWLLNP